MWVEGRSKLREMDHESSPVIQNTVIGLALLHMFLPKCSYVGLFGLVHVMHV